ncbi:MAG: hypothetical protein FJX72_16950 [Armatimonadetes bacterium]|nr:hypothetical protein [Armatimonadota bacterium]
MGRFAGAFMVAGVVALASGSVAQERDTGMRLALPALSVAGGGVSTLIRRSDVQGALRLGMRQRSAINETLNQQQPGRVMVSVRADQNSTPDSLRQQADDQIRAQIGDRDGQIKAVLKAEQWERLLQLDLQWRGPLALADPKVAARVELSGETRSLIAPVATVYNATKSEVMASLAQRHEDVSPDGSRRSIAMRLNTSELDKPMSPARKKLEKAKREAEDEILGALTPDEKRRWKSACGEPFTFRSDIKGSRF